MFDKPNVLGNSLGAIESGASVEICGYEKGGFYKVKYKDGFGYIGDNTVIDTPLLAEMRRPQEQAAAAAAAAEKANMEPLLRQLIERWGDGAGRRIYRKEYWIGMTTAMARDSLGWPDNETTTQIGDTSYETYFYPKVMLSFKNGILESYSTR